MNYPITTIEQSERLLKLGIDPATADAYYQKHNSMLYTAKIGTSIQKGDIPAWSLNNLMYALKTKNKLLRHQYRARMVRKKGSRSRLYRMQ